MIALRVLGERKAPAERRLDALAHLDGEALAALRSSMARSRSYRARRDLLTEGRPIVEPLLILDGWAARVHLLRDGRRQIVNFILPGDLVGMSDFEHPVASSSVVALTDVEVCVPPDPTSFPVLGRAYAISRALDHAHLQAQVTRLGRMNAHERIADLLLELLERLELSGLATGGRYDLPITQETLADNLGLTSVHVNRMLQAHRRTGEIEWARGTVTLFHPDALRRLIGRSAISVTASA